MHIPDGFLAPPITLPALAISVPLWIWGVKKHFGTNQATALPMLGTLTAVAFALQTIMIPIPGGTSTHVVGAALLALLRGPLVAFICESMVLVLQALFFGAGGITVVGVNALALGLMGPLAAWAFYRLFQQRLPRLLPFLAGYLSIQISSLVVVMVLGLQHHLNPTVFPTPFPIMLMAVLLPSLTITGILEGAYTLFCLRFFNRLARNQTTP